MACSDWSAHLLKLAAEVSEELYPELSIMHVMQSHLTLDLVTDQVPTLVTITPLSCNVSGQYVTMECSDWSVCPNGAL